MTETLEFGLPPSWAYPTIGALRDVGTPLPERIRVRIDGRANRRIDIDESLLINDEDTKNEIIETAISRAGSYDVGDFVEKYVLIQDGRAHVVGYILLEERITKTIEVWSDDSDEDILDSFMDTYDFDLSLQRLEGTA